MDFLLFGWTEIVAVVDTVFRGSGHSFFGASGHRNLCEWTQNLALVNTGFGASGHKLWCQFLHLTTIKLHLPSVSLV